MEIEVLELSQSKVWKPQLYMRCLQCRDDSLNKERQATSTQISTAFSTNVKNNPYQWKHEYRLYITGELEYFLGSQLRGLNHEFKARSLTKRFDTESSKLISLRGSIDAIVQCKKAQTTSLVYITESQPQLGVDFSLCEDTQIISNPHYFH